MIKIEDLIPLLKKGWVAMDEDETWVWYATKPFIQKKDGIWQVKKSVTNTSYDEPTVSAFDIAPADDWTQSLIKVKGVK